MSEVYMDKRLNQLPTWLWSNSASLPPIYKIVWEAVREDKVKSNGAHTEVLVDTNKVFPLLLTSQLSTEVLGHIWNLANRKYAGQLTEQELYIVLALVAAAQASYTFNSLDVLHLLPFPPIPYLNIECVLNVQSMTHSNSGLKPIINVSEGSNVKFFEADDRYNSEVKTKLKNSQLVFSGRMACLETESNSSNNWSRDVRHFKTRAETKHTSMVDNNDDFSEFQSAPIPSVSTIPSWDTRQGSAIGSRLANHNLGVKKFNEKSKRNNTSTNNLKLHFNAQSHTSSLSSNSVSQNLPLERLSELFPKCTVKNQSKTVILKDTAIRNNDLSKNNYENMKDHKNVSIESTNLPNTKVAAVKLDFIEKPPALDEVKTSQPDLMNLQPAEDKYSALRELIQETSESSKVDSSSNDCITSNDDFGEFVSADQPAISNASDNLMDIFTELEPKVYNSSDNSNVVDSNLMQEISQSLDNIKFEDNIEEQKIEEKFEPVSESVLSKTIQKEDTASINSIEFISGVSDRTLTRSGSVPSLDLKSFLPTNTEEDQTAHIDQQGAYSEWKQYMESCVLLLQITANIFTSITSEVVLNEVLNSLQGYNFLRNLAEVAAVCRRVNFSYKEMDITIAGFDDLLMDIDKIWAEMEPFYTNIPIVTELPAWPLHQGESISCALCLTVITSDRVVYNENNYHVTCANLWLNCVSGQLPVIQYPTFYSHTNMYVTNSHI